MADEHDHLEGLLGKLPPAALRVVEAVKARNNPPPPPVDLVEDHQPVLAPDEAPAPGLAEAALDFDYEVNPREPANSNEMPAEVIALPGNTFEIDNAIAKIDGAPAEARGELGDERRQLEALRTAPGGNRQVPQALLNAINTRIEAAAREQAETPQAKVDRLVAQLEKVDKKTKEVSEKLDHLKTQEEKEKEKAREEERDKAKAEYERLRNDPNATKEQRDAALKAWLVSREAYDNHMKEFFERVEKDHSFPEQDREAAREGLHVAKESKAIHNKITVELEKAATLVTKSSGIDDEEFMDLGAVEKMAIHKTDSITTTPQQQLAVSNASAALLGDMGTPVASAAAQKTELAMKR